MARENVQMKRELKRLIEKVYLKPISKNHGYKIIGGIPYIVHNDWLYTILLSNTHNSIHIVIEVKPVIIDEVFWTVFEMKEEVSNKPLSFHVNAAFAPWRILLIRTVPQPLAPSFNVSITPYTLLPWNS